jgi:hypothetical protein
MNARDRAVLAAASGMLAAAAMDHALTAAS